MKRLAKLSSIAALGLLAIAPLASATPRPPRVIIRGGFGYPAYGPAFYGPYWWGPGYYWGYPYGEPAPTTGQIKFDQAPKGATLYVDGGYVGPAQHNKKITLTPGNHDVELRHADGSTVYRQTVDVISGKTTELGPGYAPSD